MEVIIITTTKPKLTLPFMCYDIVFKAIFTGEENILAKMISSITGINYLDLKDNLAFETNEIPISRKNEKAKRCDFILRMNNNNIINLEINTSYYKGKKIKNLAYICGLYSTSTKRKEEYDDKFFAIQINLDCYKKEENKVLEQYLLQEVTSHKTYTNNLSIFNLNVVKCNEIYYNCGNKEEITDYIKWGALIYTRDFSEIPNIARDILTEKEVKKIMSKIEKLNNDSLFMSELEAMEWQEWEDRSIMTEARNEGYNSGFQLGIEQGLEQGLEQGIDKGISQTIKNMFKNNLSIDIISKVTNKTVNEINEIIKEI